MITRYFKRQVLDYPHADTPKSSRKFVKAMKRLPVSSMRCNIEVW